MFLSFFQDAPWLEWKLKLLLEDAYTPIARRHGTALAWRPTRSLHQLGLHGARRRQTPEDTISCLRHVS